MHYTPERVRRLHDRALSIVPGDGVLDDVDATVGHVLSLSSNKDEGVRLGGHCIHNSIWTILLQHNALWLKNAGKTYQRMMQTCL